MGARVAVGKSCPVCASLPCAGWRQGGLCWAFACHVLVACPDMLTVTEILVLLQLGKLCRLAPMLVPQRG